MQDFLKELPTLIITIAVLATLLLIIALERPNITDTLALAGILATPAISFWFLGRAYNWQPTQAAATPLQGVSTPPQQEKQP